VSADRRKHNLSEGVSFYEVKSAKVFDFAIGVVGDVSEPRVKEGVVHVGIGSDGIFERFTFCATSEGLSFNVWASAPFEKDPVWSGYYYLGYDVERTCP